MGKGGCKMRLKVGLTLVWGSCVPSCKLWNNSQKLNVTILERSLKSKQGYGKTGADTKHPRHIISRLLPLKGIRNKGQ